MKKYFFSVALMAAFAIGFTASDEDIVNGNGTVVDNTTIPDDDQAEPNPIIVTPTTSVPNIQTSFEDDGGIIVLKIDMTGVKNQQDLDWLKLYGTGLSNQNVWVEIDGKPKGIEVINITEQTERQVMTDIVFTVDNSGSMGQEANKIANDIIKWAELLANSHLDARFAVVGFGGNISGAIDLCDVATLSNYLNYSSGTSRTKHFGGENGNQLSQWANEWPRTGYGDSNECGAMAIEFANEYFSFRTGANRIYVNFTDEPNQPSGKDIYSVKYFESQLNWPAAYGTVHTVYSSGQFSNNSWNYNEQPWLISEYTGGTTQFIRSDAADLDLTKILVTQAMQNSYIIRLKNVGDLINDGLTHEIHVTIKSEENGVITTADKIFYVEFKM